MPPQEYIPQPGIDDETPRQTHRTDTVVTQDPLKRFEIVERLGYGSSGSSVFKALDKADSLKTIAIKKIPLSSLSDGFGGSDLNRQVDVDYFVSCIADHSGCWRQYVDNYNDNKDYEEETQRKSLSKYTPGLDKIVQCLGVHQTDTELWLSLEYCGGGSVEDLIRLSDGPLAESEIGWIMSQILLGITFLHNKDHIHGDIKASNILITTDGKIKLGGSGSVMNHKEGAGERKRRRRSLAMTEFPTSWLAPESNPSSPTTPTTASGTEDKDWTMDNDKPHNDALGTKQRQWMPNASAVADVWALGVACIELSQGRAPGPDMPILALFGEQRIVGSQSTVLGRRSDGSLIGNMGWSNNQQTETFGAARMGISEVMWSFIARCLTPEPEFRPSVQELLEDPFIERYSEPSTEFLGRIQRMMEFVDQCASISSDTLYGMSSSSLPPSSSSSSTLSSSSSSLTLSPSKASNMVDMKLEEASIAPWVIPMVRPRVDSVYDASSFFDEAGLPTSPPEPGSSNNLSGWKHQKVSHPVVKQALLCEQAGYMIFRHSRSPSLATIVESQLEEDKEIGLGQLDDHMIDYGGFCGLSAVARAVI
ncbi:hypothetical protein BGX26_003988 [Mortierella sp. AD094]|nr:hypothetical protein BGX26_003988 [Mortierella sp. AD094]